MSVQPKSAPDWNRLFETAAAQDGYFSTRQAAESGYSTHLLIHHIRSGKVERTRRGIYRLVHFPTGEYASLVVPWLWSDRTGVVSHQTALALHQLSDVLPARTHLTLPEAWRHRRLRVPRDVELHYDDVLSSERTWFGPVPITSPRRSLNDVAKSGLSPEQLRHAARQAIRRGLAEESDLKDVAAALEPFGGLAS